MVELDGKRIVITGPTGQVAKPLALALAKNNEVTAIARFNNAAARADLEAGGVRCVAVDLAAGDFSGISGDVDYVVNMAVAKTKSFDDDLAANVEGLGLLMNRFQKAKAFLHCSSTAVYQANGHRAFKEDDELGDNHRVMSFMPTYSINKIAAEAMARYGARQWQLPTVIARLNVPYGDNGGWPWMHLEQVLGGQQIAVHTDEPSVSTRFTRTTSSGWCRDCSTWRLCRRRSSTGVAMTPSRSKSGRSTWATWWARRPRSSRRIRHSSQCR